MRPWARARLLRRAIRMRLAALMVLAVAITLPTPAFAASPTVSIAALTPAAFSPNGDGVDETVSASVTISAAANLQVVVRNYDGKAVKTLRNKNTAAGTTIVTWTGAGVLDGPYAIVATAGTSTATLQIARWSTLPTLHAPASMYVVLDPGHGGTELGASYALANGTVLNEKALNLSIALREAWMLRAAGIVVYLTRTTDTTVPLYDRTTFSNDHSADVFLSIHNNANPTSQSGAMVFYCSTGCTNTATSKNLGDRVMGAMVDRISPLNAGSYTFTPPLGTAAFDDYTWWVNYRGCTPADPIACHFAVLGPYDPTSRPKALMTTGVLAEHLNMNNPTELAMLADTSVLTRLAAGDADGIARFFAARAVGIRLYLASAVPALAASKTATFSVRVTNNGSSAIPSGSYLLVGDRSRVSGTDNSGVYGTTIGKATTSASLAPGSSVTLNVSVLPTVCGSRTWKVDFVVNGVRVTSYRTPPLQIQASVTC